MNQYYILFILGENGESLPLAPAPAYVIARNMVTKQSMPGLPLPFRLGAPPLKPHKTSAAPNALAQIGIAESQGFLQNPVGGQQYTLLLY